METLLSISLGLGLAAACGFRVFLPILVLGVGAASGRIALVDDLSWLASTPVLVALGTATVLEIGAYYVPWLDNLLDAVATPAAVIAGTVVAASVVTDMDPALRWALAVIAGGGVAGITQTTTALARLGSSLGSGGIGNPIVASLELLGALALSVGGMVMPLVVGLLVVTCVPVVGILAWRTARRRTAMRAA